MSGYVSDKEVRPSCGQAYRDQAYREPTHMGLRRQARQLRDKAQALEELADVLEHHRLPDRADEALQDIVRRGIH